MKPPCRNVSQVKLNIKKIIDNLQLLSNYEGHESNLESIKTNTENLLSTLEKLPLERFKSKIKKRQKKKLTILQKLNSQDSTMAKVKNDAVAPSELTATIVPRTPKDNFDRDHYSKSIKECKRFLQTFELLEKLHLLRSQNSSNTYKFAFKLRQLKSIWNSLLQEKLQEQNSTDVTIQQQWNKVLFGPPEKTYFRNKPDLSEFIRKRQIWDSYIDNKYGSSIPLGWIVPHAETSEEWRQYLCPL